MNVKGFLCWLICSIVLGAKLFAMPLDTVSFDQLPALQQKEKRLVFVLISTDWCKYCHTMQRSLADSTMAPLLGNSYYYVVLNAAEQRPIRFNEHTFRYKPSGVQVGVHELAAWLGKDKEGLISYPTICILNEKNEILFRYNGFLRRKELHKVLTYYVSQ